MKRWLSLLLTLTMLAGVLPSAAFAAPEREVTAPVSADAVETASAQNERTEVLLENLARHYSNQNRAWELLDPWIMVDMSVWQRTHPDGVKLSSWARQSFINEALVHLDGTPDEHTLAVFILGLTALGVDPREVYTLAEGERLDAIDFFGGLAKSEDAWSASFTLMVYKLADYYRQDEVDDLLNALLDHQRKDGSWEEYGETIQVTANVLAALTLYAGESERAAKAVEDGIAYLSSQQWDNGAFGYEKGSTVEKTNCTATAMAVIALCSAGVAPHTDPRFIKNGNSLLDGLLSFALDDNSGFGYEENENFYEVSSEQGFCALLAYEQLVRTGKAFNVYDIGGQELAPARGAVIDNLDGSVTLSVPENTLVELPIGIPGHVLATTYDGPEGAYDVYIKKSYSGNGTTKAILSGGSTLFMTNQEIKFLDVKPGDWFAKAVDFNADRGVFAGVDSPEGKTFLPDLAMDRAMAVTVLRSLEDGWFFGEPEFEDVKEDDWFAESVGWAKDFGITSGVDATHFAPTAKLTRQELAMMLFRYAENLGMDVSGRADLSGYADDHQVADWSAQAMAWAVDSGIISGVDGNRLAPTIIVTRCQAAQMMMKLVMNMVGYQETALDAAVLGTRTYLDRTIRQPQPGQVLGGEWVITGLARSGDELTEGYFHRYYGDLERYVQECKGVLHERKYTEYSRTVLALTAIGADPGNVGGYNLLAPLADYDKTVWQGPNGAIWALIALNSGDYALPQGTATEARYVDKVLADQLADGGWAMTGRTPSDPDLTAMALQALADYRGDRAVEEAVEKALAFLSQAQTAEGAFIANKVANAESCAQVLIALNRLDIPVTDARFVKNGKTVLDALLTFRNGDGSFRHVQDGKTDEMATEQGMLALASAWRWEHGKLDLYSMGDAQSHANTAK